MQLASSIVFASACVVLGACAAIDSLDRIRDRDPLAIASLVLTGTSTAWAFAGVYAVLAILGTAA